MPHSPIWAEFARQSIRRLCHAESQSFQDLDICDETITPVADPPPPSLITALNTIEAAQTRDSAELDDMRAAGLDGYATDASGSAQPAHSVAPEKLALCLRLAATFATKTRFSETVLAPRGITLLCGLKAAELDAASHLIGKIFLPTGWQARSRTARSPSEPVLLVIRPNSSLGAISPANLRDFEQKILAALGCPHPVLVLVPEGLCFTPELQRILPRPLQLAHFDQDMMLMLLGQTHSATGRIDTAQVRPQLPQEDALRKLDTPALLAALRAPTAAAAARRLADILREPVTQAGAMTLAEINGQSPAHRAAAELVADLRAWRDGRAKWSEIPHSLLISGEPGTGKSVLARAIAASAQVPLIDASFGAWQSTGHLGDMLGAMRKSFAEAISQRPSVLFIDEIDAAGSRDGDDRNANYRRNVINQFLAEIDGLMRAEGVLLLGACNHPRGLDPAILRVGRFDQHAELGRPPLRQIRHMLARALPENADPDDLARTFIGQTPAEIDGTLRAARASARRAGRMFDAAWLASQLPQETAQDKARQRRIAIHECGHALCATLFGAPVHSIQMSSTSGVTHRATLIHEGTVQEFEAEMTTLMGGRAAERMMLGTISAGAGGSDESDLATASKLQLHFDREAGLGTCGNAWLGPAVMKHLSQSEQDRLRAKLDLFERRARRLLEPHRDRIEHLAQQLITLREMSAADLHPWLSDLTEPRPPKQPCQTSAP